MHVKPLAIVAASLVPLLAIVSPTRSDVPPKRPARHPSAVLAHQAERMASDAIARYLRESVADEAWRVTTELSDEQVQLIGVAEGPLVAIGGESPWTGNQTFELRVKGNGAAPLTVKADVALPPTIVVATHAVPRGTVVRASDIRLQRVSAETSVTSSFQLAEDVVGKEAVKPISPGQTIDANYVRPQILVHSGEVVTLYGRNAGITVRMTARAQENGAQGELVSVESILDRKRLLARVCALQEVEIFAGAAASAAPTIQGRSEKATRNE